MTLFDKVDENIKLDELKSQNIENKFSNNLLANATANNNDKFHETKSETIEYTLNVATVGDISSTKTVDDPDDKKLLRKLDLRLIPGITLLYLLNYLDRVNIGQAKLNGITTSLNLPSAQYNACLSVVYVTYVAFEVPSNLILKKLRPSRWIPLIMVTWGIVTTLTGLVNSYGSLLACRLLLGAPEAGLFPGFVSYKAQLLTAPPYAVAFITTVTTAYFSDKYVQRGIFILFWLLITMIGYLILIVVNSLGAKYFAVFLAAGGIPPCVATCIAFLSGNTSPQTKRATSLAFMISVGNCGGIISGQIYRSEDAPRFILGHAINLGFCTLAIICTSILRIGLRLENRRRDRLYGPSTNVVITHTNTTVDMFGLGSAEDRRRWGYENMSEQEIRDLGDKHATWRYIL
ncbi:unnamed protein product [Rotaria sordida]|uniref:Uncharacterized protein n=1 Tax=Rotaria sordida TaxID=392033 RepID=A0A819BUE3_9BILA|nr:unnamed protein product [Rotaria sordida]CAF1270128.1 unnamed protein product [Rotaria sordida]CAF3809519.1 unnamed protein product [Rotaria sordida]CAF3849090.1 unnamed protein product [Rotaria sordida]